MIKKVNLISSYLYLIFTNTGNLLTGGIFGLGIFIYSTYQDIKIDPKDLILILLLFLSISGYRVWSKERNYSDEMGKNIINIKNTKVHQSKMRNVSSIEERIFIATQSIHDITQNIGLDWCAFMTNKKYSYSSTNDQSKTTLGTFIQTYMPEHISKFNEFCDLIYKFHLQRIKFENNRNNEADKEVYSLVGKIYSLESELSSLIFNSLEKMKDELVD